MRHASRPCGECPWRRDQPPGRFTAERYEFLRNTSAGPDGSAPLGAPLFACHKTAEGKEIACAGWLAIEGLGHVAVRLALVQGELDPDALEPQPDWPDLIDSYDELARINGADPRSNVTMPIAIKNEAGLNCRYGEDVLTIITEWWGAGAEITYLDPGRTKGEVHRGGEHIAFVTVYYNTGEVGWKRHVESTVLVADEGGWLSGPAELVDRGAAT